MEKRVQRSCVVDNHERRGSEEEEECGRPEIGAEAEVIRYCKQHREEGAR